MNINSFSNNTFNKQYNNALFSGKKNLPEITTNKTNARPDINVKLLAYTSLTVIGLGVLIFGRKKISNFMQNIIKSPKVTNNILHKDVALERLEDLRKTEQVTFWERVKNENGEYRDNFIGQNIYILKDSIYKKLRRASYKPEGFSDIANITKTSTDKIKVLSQNGWHYRKPINFNSNENMHSIERISLNVLPDEKLIQQLDKYFAEHLKDVQGYYKTPSTFNGWCERHDPITIYLHRSAKETTVLEDIAKIAEPFVRNTGNGVLLGKKYAIGCAWQISPSEKEKHEILKRFEDIFGNAVAKKIAGYTASEKLSAGEICAFNEILNKITGQSVEVLIP